MSKLSEMTLRKGKVVDIGGIAIEIKPLTVSAMPLMMELGNGTPEEQAKATMEILKISIKDAIPDATEEEIKKIPIEYIMSLTEAIMEVNQLDNMDEHKKAFLEKLKK